MINYRINKRSGFIKMAFTDYQYDNYVSRQLALAVLEKHLQFNGRYDYY